MKKSDDYINDKAAESLSKAKRSVSDTVRTYMFDIAGIAVIIASALIALGAMKIIDDIGSHWQDILVSMLPFWIAASLLDDNYYTKGTFRAKRTEKYSTAMKTYSDDVASITGAQLDALPDFCTEYNERALVKLQTSILRRRAISYERFNDITVDDDGNKLQPLKSLSKKELKQLYNKETVSCIIKAQNAKIKGITDNLLLSNIRSNDDTDIGKNESEMHNERRVFAGIKYFVIMFLFALVAFKDVQEWGWAAAAFVFFKMVWIFFKTYIAYYKGYNDITINLVSHVMRKDDIIKQFKYWYSTSYGKGVIVKNENILLENFKEVDKLA